MLVFYYFGGPGQEEVLRDQASLASLLQAFDAWAPAYGTEYEPGWRVSARPEPAAYQARLAESKAYRRGQVTDIARAFSDEQYYSLHRQFVDLQARNPSGFVEGTPDFELSRQLQQSMSDYASREVSRAGKVGPERTLATFESVCPLFAANGERAYRVC